LGCEAYEDRLIEHALGTLSQDESVELREHLARGCPHCAGRLAELRETLSLLPFGLPGTEAPTGVRQRLLDRARGTAPMQKVFPRAAESGGRWWIGVVAGSAIAAAVLIVCGGAWMREQRTVRQLTSQLTQRNEQVTDLRNALASEEETARSIRSPSALMVSLEGAARPSGQGRIFIDPAKGKWWFAARGLQPLPSDKTYEFWLIPQGKKPIAAGTFDVDGSGVGYVTGTVPPDIGAGALAAVTDEPAGGVPQPTGAIQIKGAIGQ
jgi:anti-sigma-K factor RskA